MDSTYALDYRRLHEQHWWWRARQHEVLATLAELYRDSVWYDARRRKRRRGTSCHTGRARILDVGCGDGLLFDELAEFGEVEGVEIDGSIVSATNRWRAHITISPFDERFQPRKQYDTILMLDVLEHLPDPRGAVRHALQLLTAEGTLLVTVPAFRQLWTTHDDLNHHFTRYTRETFRELVEGLGTIHSMRYFFHWLFPAKLAVRAKEKLLPTKPRSPRVPGGLTNGALYGLTRIEQSLLRRIPVPFGGSLLAIVGK